MEKAPTRSLLNDCEIFANLRIAFITLINLNLIVKTNWFEQAAKIRESCKFHNVINIAFVLS